MRSLLSCCWLLRCLLLPSISPAETGGACPVFQAAATDWSPANASALAIASDIAYTADHEALKKAVKDRLGLEDIVPFAWTTPGLYGTGEGGTQGFIAASDETILLVFRGTEPNAVDLLTDAWFRPVALKSCLPGVEVPGRVHEGFALALQTVWPDLTRELAAAAVRHPHAKLWLGGHSLGGALSLTAAAALHYAKDAPLRPRGAIVFGCPVTGDAEFCTSLTSALPARLYRCVCSWDLVGEDLLAQAVAGIPGAPRIPWLTWKWEVPGRLVYIDARGRAHSSASSEMQMWEALSFILSLDLRVKDLTDSTRAMAALQRAGDKLATRHRIDTAYVQALLKLARAAAGGEADTLTWK